MKQVTFIGELSVFKISIIMVEQLIYSKTSIRICLYIIKVDEQGEAITELMKKWHKAIFLTKL